MTLRRGAGSITGFFRHRTPFELQRFLTGFLGDKALKAASDLLHFQRFDPPQVPKDQAFPGFYRFHETVETLEQSRGGHYQAWRVATLRKVRPPRRERGGTRSRESIEGAAPWHSRVFLRSG